MSIVCSLQIVTLSALPDQISDHNLGNPDRTANENWTAQQIKILSKV
jgi:hypothetical protein